MSNSNHKISVLKRFSLWPVSSYSIVVFLLALFSSFEGHSQCTAIIGNYSPMTCCEVLTVQFHDSTSGPELSRTWDFGDGSPTSGSSGPLHNFPAGFFGDTTYVITLTTVCISGPTSVAYDTVRVYKKPSVNFVSNKTTLCALSDSACFTNLSSFGPGYTYLWNFGDFTTSSQFEPCHIYSTGGTYSVQLTVTNSYGCANSLTFTNYVTVIPAPTLDFNLTSFLGCAPMSVGFTNITDTLATSFSSWQWNFGDGSPVINAFNPPSHNFLLPGTYFITMTATNSLGCSNSTTKAIVVRTTPTSTFTATSPVCVGSPSLFTYTGTAGSGANYSWNFDMGVASSGVGAGPYSIYWNAAGTMNPSLTVTDSGCTSTYTIPVVVNALPVISLSVFPNDTICQGDVATFTASPATLTNYAFYVNSTLVQNSSSNTFSSGSLNTGDSLYVVGTNSNGCTGTGNNAFEMFVKPLPVVTISGSPAACDGDLLSFSALPVGLDGYSFYQGFLLLQSSPSSTYSTTSWVNGDSIHVVAIEDGCVGPPSNFIAPSISQPLLTPQVNCGVSTDSTIQFTWLPVPGATSYLVSVNGAPFIAPDSGPLGTTELVTGLVAGSSATIQVVAIGPAPCGNSDTSSVHTCYANPCSGITYSLSPSVSACSGSNVTLSLTGFSVASPSVSWNGGPFLPYSDLIFIPSGDTTVNVVVTDPSQPGCVPVSNNFIVDVLPLPVATLSVSPMADTVCQGTVVTFSTSPAGYSDYSFYNGASLLQSSNNPDLIMPDVPGTYSVNVVTSYLGCQYTTSSLPLTILPAPLVTLTAAPAGGTVCFGDTVVFTALPSGYSNYSFYNGSTLLQSSSSNTFSYAGLLVGSGNNITVTATNSDGCNSLSSNVINFTVTPPPSLLLTCTDPDLTICEGDAVTFIASPTGMSLYQFFDGTTLLQSSASNTLVTTGLLAASSVFAIGVNSSGCNSATSNSFALTVKPRPVIVATAIDTAICAGTLATLTATQTPVVPGTTYLWNTGATTPTINVSPAVNSTYIIYSTLNGCAGIPDTLTILVDNTPPPTALAGTDATICTGDSIVLNGSGGSTILWTPSLGLSDPTIAMPVAKPGATTTYTITTWDTYCTSTASVTVTVDLCLTDITGVIPSGVTPNGDGSNDFFVVPNVDYFKKNSLVIYNRWGNVIYKAAPYLNDWDGKSLNGNDLPDAVYYYVLDLGIEKEPYTGFILIQR